MVMLTIAPHLPLKITETVGVWR